MGAVFLKDQALGRIIAGHPWVYARDVLKTEKAPEDGAEITVRRADGAYVGTGFYNAKSRIPVRIFSRSKDKLDELFFKKRILEAKAYREQAAGGSLPEAYRLIWSEADFLPGL